MISNSPAAARLEIYGIHVVNMALQYCPERIIKIVYLAHKDNKKITNILNLAKKYGIAVESRAVKSKDDELVHQGVFAELKVRKLAGFADLKNFLQVRHNLSDASPARRSSQNEVGRILVLDQIQDPRNLGACLRTADAAGVDCVILPENNSAPLSAVTYKTAAGAALYLPIFYVTNLVQTFKYLKEQGFWIYGSHLKAKKSLYDCKFANKSVIVMGAEDLGMRQLVAENCDELFYIPMKGRVESLNVAVATGICLFLAEN